MTNASQRRAGAKGFGLFAAEDLEEGHFIIQYVGEVRQPLATLPPAAQEAYTTIGRTRADACVALRHLCPSQCSSGHPCLRRHI